MNIKKIFFSIIISIIFLFFILKYINIEDLKIIFQIPIEILMFCFIIYTISNIFRALRFRLFLDLKILDSIFMTFLHNMINNIIPMRIGELSILYLSKEKKIKSISALIYSRIFDVLAIITLLLISIIYSSMSIYSQIEKKFYFSSGILITIFLIISLIIYLFFKYEFYKINYLTKYKKINFLIEKIKEFKKIITLKKAIYSYVLSLLIWILNFYIAALIIKIIGINLKWYEIIFTFTFTTLISLIPIHGFLGLGTLEVGWAFILVMFGITKENALISGFVFHFINIFFFIILGIIGFLYFIKKDF